MFGSLRSLRKKNRLTARWRYLKAPKFESLEDRRMLTSYVWDGGGDGTSWSDVANWDVGGSAPGTTDGVQDDVTITMAGSYTVNLDIDIIDDGSGDALSGFTLGGSGATFSASGRTFTVDGPANITDGTVNLTNTTWDGTGTLTNQSLMNFNNGSSFAGTVSLVNEGDFYARTTSGVLATTNINGSFTNAVGGNVLIATQGGSQSTARLNVNAGMTNAGTLTLDTQGQFGGHFYRSELYVTGGALVNTGTIESLAQTEAGSHTRVLNAELDNQLGGIINIGSTVAVTNNSPAANHTNAGQINITSGSLSITGLSSVDNLASGHINASGGSLSFSGASAATSTVTNSGTITSNVGFTTSNLLSMTNNGLIAITGGTFTQNTSTLNNNGDIDIASSASLSATSATINIAVGATFDGDGTATLNQTTLDVAGAYSNGNMNLNLNNVVIQGSGSFTNTGSVNMYDNDANPSRIEVAIINSGSFLVRGTNNQFTNSSIVNEASGTLELRSENGTVFNNTQLALSEGMINRGLIDLRGHVNNNPYNGFVRLSTGGSGTLVNEVGATIQTRRTSTYSITTELTAQLDNRGTIDFTNPTATNNTTSINKTNANHINSGDLIVSGTSALSITDFESFDNSGTISSTSASVSVTGGTPTASFVNDGTVNVAGTFTLSSLNDISGSGDMGVNVSIVSSNVNPGTSPGTLTATGNYTQNTATALNIEIGGTTVDTQYDQLAVVGNASLNGPLNVTLTGGFVPSPGDGFSVLTYGSRTGTFSSITGVDLTGLVPNLMLHPVYAPTELALVAYLTTDVTPPLAPSVPDLIASSDLGDSDSDDLTSDSTPSIGGTSEPGASIELFDSAVSLGTTLAGADGSWVITTGTLLDGVHSLTAKATDIKGNTGPASASGAITIETVAPTVTVEQAGAQADPTSASPINFAVVFSESTTTFDASDVLISGTSTGSFSAVVTGAGTTYNVAVSGMVSNGTVILSVPAGGAHDEAGNSNLASTSTDNTVTYVDLTVPTVTVNQASGQADPTNDTAIDFEVVFSEPMVGFVDSDVTISGSALGVLTAVVTGSGSAYNVAVSGMTSDGTVQLDIAAGVVADIAGNFNLASTSSDNVVDFDNTPPPVPSSPDLSATSDTGDSDSDDLTNITKPTFTGTALVGSTVVLKKGAIVLGTDVADGGGNWSITSSVDLTEGTNQITATAKDAVDNESAPSGELAVNIDTVAPTVTVNQEGGQADPTSTSPIDFVVVFSEITTNFANGDVAIGGTAPGPVADSVSGSGTSYDVAISGMTSDGTVIVDLPSGVATDAAGNSNVASTSSDNVVFFDNTPPAAPPTPDLAPTSDSGNSGSDNITNITKPRFTGTAELGSTVTLFNGVTILGTDAVNAGGFWSIISTVDLLEGLNNITATATDISTNVSLASAPLAVTIDTTAPTVTLEQAAAQDDPTADLVVDFQVIFSETTTAFDASDVALGGTAGASTVLVTGTGSTYNVAISGMTEDGTAIATVNPGVFSDAAGNSAQASTSIDNVITIDRSGPTVTIDQAVGQADPTNETTIDFTVVFSDSVVGFDGSDIQLSGGALPTTAVVTGSGTTYNVAVSGMSIDGTVIADVVAGAVDDSVGNASFASTSSDNVVIYDSAGPTVTVNQAIGQSDPTNASPVNFTVIFSEAPTNFDSGSVTITGTAFGTPTSTVTGSGTTYNVAVGGMSATGDVIVDVAAGAVTDSAGNNNLASTSTDNLVIYDVTPPAAPSVPDLAPSSDSGDLNDDDLTNDNTPTFTGSGAEPNSAVTLLEGASVLGTDIADGSGNWSITSSVLSEGSHNISASNTDIAGNTGPASIALPVNIDVTGHTVTIDQAIGQPDPTNAATINFTVVFGAVTTQFDAGDVLLSGSAGATTAAVSGSGTTYTVAVSGMTSDGTVIADVAAGVFNDAAGNPSQISTSSDNVVIRDTIGPTVTVNQAIGQDDPSNVASFDFDVVFSESTTAFDSSAVLFTGTAGATLRREPTAGV